MKPKILIKIIMVFGFLLTGRTAISGMLDQGGGNNVQLFKNLSQPIQQAQYVDKGNNVFENFEYVPDEILIKVKEGKDPKTTLDKSNLNIDQGGIKAAHSKKAAIAKFKKGHPFKSSNGKVQFKGKKYKSVDGIPDEEIFEEAYKEMTPKRKGLYRNYKVKLPKGTNVKEAVNRLRDNPDVEYAYPNYIRPMNVHPSDPRYPEQWALPKVGALRAWDITQGEPSVVVAVVDTGVDYTHIDLMHNIWINPGEFPTEDVNSDGKITMDELIAHGLTDTDNNGQIGLEDVFGSIFEDGIDNDGNNYTDDLIGYDFVTATNVSGDEDPNPPDNNPMDVRGHGSHVAGIIAAEANDVGIVGLAPRSRIMVLRAGFKGVDGKGYLRDSDIEDALLYAIDKKAEVVNMSFGGGGAGAWVDEIQLAYEEGVVLIGSAGNTPSDAPNYPAALPEVIAVGATDSLDQLAGFSSYGDWVDVTAPGVGILSTIPNNDYEAWDGTSMAAPYVTGLVALILSQHPEFNVEQVRQVLRATSLDIGSIGWDTKYGYGRIDAYRALLVDSPCNCMARLDSVTIGLDMEIYGHATWDTTGHYVLSLINQITGETVYSQEYFAPQTTGVLANVPIENLVDGDYIVELIVSDDGGSADAVDHMMYHLNTLNISHPLPYQILRRDEDIVIEGVSLRPYSIVWGEGEDPAVWSDNGVNLSHEPGILGSVDISQLPESNHRVDLFTLKIVDNLGNESSIPLNLGNSLKQGWPQDVIGADKNTLLQIGVGDLSGDGLSEIITITKSGRLTVFNPDGSVLTEINHNLAGFTSPIVSDINQDGRNELVLYKYSYGSQVSTLYVYHLEGEQLTLDWSTLVEEIGIVSGGCVVADLNQDGYKEIIISGEGAGLSGTSDWSWYTTVFDHEGRRVPGWPVKSLPNLMSPASGISIPGGINPLSAVGNLDDDADLEIVTVAPGNTAFDEASAFVSIYNSDGRFVLNPTNVVSWSGQSFKDRAIYASPVVADINDDGANEVIIGTLMGVHALDAAGNVLWSAFNGSGTDTHAITDLLLTNIDDDFSPEIIVSEVRDLSTALDLPEQVTGIIDNDGRLKVSFGNDTNAITPSIIGDVNEDAVNDLITLRSPFNFDKWESTLYMEYRSSSTGELLESTELKQYSTNRYPIVADLEGDGIYELIHVMWYRWGQGQLAVWELSDHNSGAAVSDWPQFHRDAELTGHYIVPQHPLSKSVSFSSPFVGQDMVFQSVSSDTWGVDHISLIDLKIDGSDRFWMRYDKVRNQLFLRNDEDTTWLGGCTPGTAGTISNAIGTLDCSRSGIYPTDLDSDLFFNWWVRLDTPLEGNVYLYTENLGGLDTGWKNRGPISVINEPLSFSPVIQDVYLNPAGGIYLSGAGLFLRVRVTDPDNDIASVEVQEVQGQNLVPLPSWMRSYFNIVRPTIGYRTFAGTLPNAAQDTVYTFRVTAWDTAMNTTTQDVSFTVLRYDPPATPQGLTAVAQSSTEIKLDWHADADAVEYVVFRNNTYVTRVATNSYLDTQRNPSTNYSYSLKAIDAEGYWSEMPATVSISTLPAPPTPSPSPIALYSSVYVTNPCGADMLEDAYITAHKKEHIPAGAPLQVMNSPQGYATTLQDGYRWWYVWIDDTRYFPYDFGGWMKETDLNTLAPAQPMICPSPTPSPVPSPSP